jgi:hypothetical protein
MGKAFNMAAVVPTNIMVIAAGLTSAAGLAPLRIMPAIRVNTPIIMPRTDDVCTTNL